MRTRCLLMVGPDTQMDQTGDDERATNVLPIKCSHCTFPDIDFVPKPYLLARTVSSSVETAPAVLGNFFVQQRVRRILENAVPKSCYFYSTADRKKKATPWWLAVPTV